MGTDEEDSGERLRLGNGNIIDRPIQKVFPMEVRASVEKSEGKGTDIKFTRPICAAKMIAKERLDISDQYK